jgi:hypothetical protein
VRTQSLTSLQDEIRNHIDILMPSAKTLECTVSQAQLQAFNPRRGRECCTPSNFRFNLEGTARDIWNTSATRVFVNHFLEAHQKYPADNQVVRSMVTKKTTSAIRSLIKLYRAKDKSSGDLKTAVKRRNRRERKRTVGNSLKSLLLHSRS